MLDYLIWQHVANMHCEMLTIEKDEIACLFKKDSLSAGCATGDPTSDVRISLLGGAGCSHVPCSIAGAGAAASATCCCATIQEWRTCATWP